ncbi:MAG TPA: hypothetical protein VM638_02370 [Actinomycetota bacterium]|nr:hypothetical protein [Actinomycetota bacterium]
MKVHRIATPLVLVAALALAPGATAHPGPATHVDSLSATVSGSFLNVSGTATFVDVPFTAADDPSGDATPAGIGADITKATISRAPNGSTLVFRLDVADMPALGSTGIRYGWGLSVNGNDTGLYLGASRIGSCGTNGCFTLSRSSGSTTSVVANLTGSITATSVTWNVPMATLGVTRGSTVGAGAALTGSITGGEGLGHCCFIIDGFTAGDYRVPGAIVELGLAPAGAQPSTANFLEVATVDAATGAFSGSLPKPQSGSWQVVAKACYVATVCGYGSLTL